MDELLPGHQQARILDRYGRLSGENLEQPYVVVVERLAVRGERDYAADAPFVLERHREQRQVAGRVRALITELARNHRTGAARGSGDRLARRAGRQVCERTGLGLSVASRARRDALESAVGSEQQHLRAVIVDHLARLVAQRRGQLGNGRQPAQARGNPLDRFQLADPA